MQVILLVAIGFICAVGASGNTKIVNGERADRGEFPWYVAFFYEGYNVEGNELFCGGTILDEYYILSAAHCFYGYYDLEPYYLAAGKFKLYEESRSEQWRNISSFTIHPGFDNDTYVNDIIVVKVDVPFVFNRFVQPAMMLESDDKLPKDETCLMAGLGWIDEKTETMAENLQKYEVNIVSNKKCKKEAAKFGREDEITNRLFCTKNKKQGACNHDSGGPVGCFANGNHTLIGVRSWTVANQSCKRGWNVVMNVAKYRGFIDKIVMADMEY